MIAEAALAQLMTPGVDEVRLRVGSITAVNNDGTVSLTLGGAAKVLTNVRCLSSVWPFIGAQVWCAKVRSTLLVLGVQETQAGWSTSSTNFTAAANFSINAVKWRRVGGLGWLYVIANRTTAALAVAAGDGDIANTTVFSAVEPLMLPDSATYGHAGGSGRVCVSTLGTGGAITVNALAGDGTNVAIADVLSMNFAAYPLAA